MSCVSPAAHGTSRETGDAPNSHPATRRTYVYRCRVRCRNCRRRMAGWGAPSLEGPGLPSLEGPAVSGLRKRRGLRPYLRAACSVHLLQVPARPGQPQARRRHYRPLPHRPGPETDLGRVVGLFFATRIFGLDRAKLLAEQMPAATTTTTTDAAAHRDAQAAALKTRLSRWTPLAGDVLPGLPTALKAQHGQQATGFAEITEATLRDVPGILDPPRTASMTLTPSQQRP